MNSTEQFVAVITARLTSEIAHLVNDLGLTHEQAIAQVRAKSIAGPKVWALITAGATPVEALRTVCGAEVVDAMIGEVYDALRAQ